MKIPSFNRREILDIIISRLAILQRHSFPLFIAFIVCLYGFLLLRVNSLINAQPQTADVTSQVKAAAIPHIDKAVVKQLQSLQDNSVSVQLLIAEKARVEGTPELAPATSIRVFDNPAA